MSAPEDFFSAMVASCSEALMTFDPYADRVIDANGAACRLLGYDRRELLSKAVSWLHHQHLPALVVFSESVLEKGRAWTRELGVRRADGETVAVEYSAARLDWGDTPKIVVTAVDPRVRRQRENSADADAYLRSGLAEWQRVERLFQEIERENQLILRAAGEGIYGVNGEGKTTFVNPAAERMLGWSAEELVGRDMHAIVHHSHADGAPYPSRHCPIYAAFRDGVVQQVEDEVFWRKDGKPLRVEYTSTPIRDRGMVVGAVIVFRDISRRKETEARLRAALDEVNELRERLEAENAYLQEEITEHSHSEIIGKCRAIQHLLHQIELVAPTDANVLLTGESGTGKELIARAIHEASERSDRPLIRVNCAAIPHELFESEFFGHTKGAFTGALRDRVGRFELAGQGTLFLDEVGEIPLELQGKLLRVLQDGQFERVGEETTRRVDVRLIAATNRDLSKEIEAGRFREDLYFRLNVFPIRSVPLRERKEDIALLAAHFLRSACRKLKIPELKLTRANVAELLIYDWPGNVRELENVVERSAILARNGRLRFDLPAGGPSRTPTLPAEGLPLEGDILTATEMRRRERANIRAALAACGGRVFGEGGAAALLEMKPTTLASRIKALGIERR